MHSYRKPQQGKGFVCKGLLICVIFNPSSIIYYTHSKDINAAQWDECVQQSPDDVIYARSFYLSNMSPGWGGLTGENYEWVLPLVCNNKFGISYLYQPPFTQQSGVYARPGAKVPYQKIIEWLKSNYKYWEVSWDAATVAYTDDSTIIKTEASNFTLDLLAGYETIAGHYHNDLIKNLKRSRQFEQLYQPSEDYNKNIDLYIDHYAKRTPHVHKRDYDNFRKLCHFAQQNNMILCRNSINTTGNILATALLLHDGKRLYNMMNTTTNEGRKMSANHFLIDSIIREFSGTPLIFDFEGSDLPGVKNFYENFCAVNKPYYLIKYNNLPWPARLFKQ